MDENTTVRQNFFVDYENQEQEQPQQEAQEVESVQPEVKAVAEKTKVEQPVESSAVRNLREQKLKLERENAEMANRLKQLEESQKASYDPDDLVQRKYVDSTVQELKKELQKTTSEYKLKMQYPDFDKVVNDATIQVLKERHPSLAMTIGQAYDRDNYNGAAAAYEAIKNMGIYTEDSFYADRERAQINAGKPRMSQSVATAKPNSPIAAANAFSDELQSEEYRKNLYKEMMHYAKQK